MCKIDMNKVKMQFISHFTEQYSYLDSIKMALEGGCRWVQLRMKEANDEEFVRTGKIAREMCHEYGATFIIDDHVELVREIGADGVHLGKKDMPIAQARQILGEQYIIGGTANTIEDVLQHYESSADYIGCGPFRFTTTKKNLSPILGLEGYQNIVEKFTAYNHKEDERQVSKNAEVNAASVNGLPIPIVAIGGITANDIPSIMQTGVSGIALSGTVLRADNPVEEMARLMKMIIN